jgi:uncharacterized protein (DUF302 family)
MTAADGLKRRIQLPYDDTVRKTKIALRDEGFGVLTEIDVRATLQEKLGVDFRDYVIIGACNPPLAHRALESDLDVGTLLPCNVVIYADGDESVITAFDPEAGAAMSGSSGLAGVAQDAKVRLLRAIAAVDGEPV